MTGQNIILTGFMGTGKTTVGKLLAEVLGYEFVDTDEMIMAQCNSTVAQIFEAEGEQGFRKRERDLVLELAQRQSLVISTGGGMMLDSANVNALGREGKIFCLVAEPEKIIARISGDRTIERPLLKVADPEARVAELLNERKEIYGRFVQVDTTGITPDAVCKVIMDMLENRQRSGCDGFQRGGCDLFQRGGCDGY